MPPLELADILVQLDRLHALRGQDEERSLPGPQERMPGKRSELVGFDPGATELLPRHTFQQPRAIRADVSTIRLDQPLQLAAGGKLV